MIAKDALAQANLLPFSPSLKSGLLRHRRLSLAAQLAQQAPAGACCGEFFNFSCNDRTRKKPFFFPSQKPKRTAQVWGLDSSARLHPSAYFFEGQCTPGQTQQALRCARR